MFKDGAKYGYLVTVIGCNSNLTKISDMAYFVKYTGNLGYYDKAIISAVNNITGWKQSKMESSYKASFIFWRYYFVLFLDKIILFLILDRCQLI